MKKCCYVIKNAEGEYWSKGGHGWTSDKEERCYQKCTSDDPTTNRANAREWFEHIKRYHTSDDDARLVKVTRRTLSQRVEEIVASKSEPEDYTAEDMEVIWRWKKAIVSRAFKKMDAGSFLFELGAAMREASRERESRALPASSGNGRIANNLFVAAGVVEGLSDLELSEEY